MKIDLKLDNILINLVENMHGLCGFKRLDLTVGWMTPVMSRLAGFKNSEEMAGLTDYDIKASAVKFAKEFRAQDRAVLTNKMPYEGLDIMRYADGNLHVLRVKKTLILDNDNNPYGVFCQADHISNDLLNKLTRFLITMDKRYKNKNIEMQSYQILKEDLKDKAKVKFSKRQVECFFYIIRGFSASEIATILHVSKRTIENHINAIKIKLGCSKKSELIDAIIGLGYLNVIPSSIINTLTNIA